MPAGEEGTSEARLKRALARMTSDIRERGFYKLPFELEFSMRDRRAWLTPIKRQLNEGAYVPNMASSLDTPKPKWHIRPAAFLSLNDSLVYHYLALACLPNIRQHLEWTEGKIRFSNKILSENEGQWFSKSFVGWKQFNNRSIEILNSEYKYVLKTDIAGFYENIDIARLDRELRALGVDNTTLKNLSTCLNKWSQPRERGIPQGFSPSDLFAEFYLDTLDRHLHSEEFVHLRYVDDIRIFARTELTARRALHALTKHLRERGLNLQTAKTQILQSEIAKSKINKVSLIIDKMAEQLAEEFSELEGLGDPYMPSIEEQIAELRGDNPDSASVEVIDRAWDDFITADPEAFDKTIFHFLMRRAPGITGKDFVISTIFERPEETERCLKYLKQRLVLLNDADIDQVAAIIDGTECLYSYQRYQVLKWFYDNSIRNERVISCCREHVHELSGDLLCRSYSYAYLGSFAESHDYETLQNAYIKTPDWLERAIIVCAMHKAPTAIRSNFYGRIKGENPLVNRAIKWASSNLGSG